MVRHGMGVAVALALVSLGCGDSAATLTGETTGGDAFLGGQDVDNLIVDWVLQKMKENGSAEYSSLADIQPRYATRLRQADALPKSFREFTELFGNDDSIVLLLHHQESLLSARGLALIDETHERVAALPHVT